MKKTGHLLAAAGAMMAAIVVGGRGGGRAGVVDADRPDQLVAPDARKGEQRVDPGTVLRLVDSWAELHAVQRRRIESTEAEIQDARARLTELQNRARRERSELEKIEKQFVGSRDSRATRSASTNPDAEQIDRKVLV
ncbi:MAG: hypothetical protein P4L84_21550 [Isosphaeraceae bacterium]|nr:hypothetical protein [Isosphaeraceae bacterium]